MLITAKRLRFTGQKPFKQAGWHVIGSQRIYFRSKWEVKFAHFLEWMREKALIQGWAYESKTFWFDAIKRGCVSYKPDFAVFFDQGETIWVEVKGFMDQRSIVALKRFKRYFPNEKILVIQKDWFGRHSVLNWNQALLTSLGPQEFLKEIFYKQIQKQAEEVVKNKNNLKRKND